MAHILLVEDNEDYANIVCDILTDAGHTVTVADSLAHAKEAVKQETFDLIWLDPALPDSPNGDDTFVAMHAIRGLIPLMIVTGGDAPDIRGAALVRVDQKIALAQRAYLLDVVNEMLAKREIVTQRLEAGEAGA